MGPPILSLDNYDVNIINQIHQPNDDGSSATVVLPFINNVSLSKIDLDTDCYYHQNRVHDEAGLNSAFIRQYMYHS